MTSGGYGRSIFSEPDMATNILSIGNTDATSQDFDVTTSPVIVSLKYDGAPVNDQASVEILLADDESPTQYWLVGKLTAYAPFKELVAPGTYRFHRKVGVSCGVFSG